MMDAANWIALTAAAVSVLAALFSSLQARQARRQADAAHGDIKPTFHIERLHERSSAENCRVVCRNYNRHALVMHEVRIHHPANIALVPNSSSVRDAIDSAVIEAAVERDDLCVIRPKTTLEGVAPGKDPAEYKFGLRVVGAARASSVSRMALQFSDIESGRIINVP